MAEESNTKPGVLFWALGSFFALWNVLGLYMYYDFSTLTPEKLQAAGYSAGQVAHVFDTPAWAHSAYAIAVNAGVLGAIFLLLRKAWAVPMFIISLVGAILQFTDGYLLRNGLDLFEPVWLVIPTFVVLICIVEIWYSRNAKGKGWLG